MTSFLQAALSEGRRLLYLMGMATDSFCTSSTLTHSLESLLLLQLREQGFKRIVYYSASKKLHWMDIETARHCKVKSTPNQAVVRASPTVQTICKGPLIGPLKRPTPANKAASSPATEEPVRWNYGEMFDSDVVRIAQAWLLDPAIPTALIIRDTGDLLSHFDPGALRAMNELFLNVQRAGSQGFCILIFQQHQSTEMLTRSQGNWPNLIAPMLTRAPDDARGVALSSSVLIIGPPSEREISHALKAGELSKEHKMSAQLIQDKATQLARQARFAYAEHNERAGHIGGLYWLGLQKEGSKTMQQMTAMQRLEAMTGMKLVAEKLRGLILRVKEERLRFRQQLIEPEGAVNVDRLNIRQGRPLGGVNLHLALMGNPGTGKTQVARLIAEIYHEEGLLETGHLVEVTRKDLVGGYVGQTAINSGAAVQRALGGVLFIDEAYQLADGGDNDFGQEAIATVMKAMSDHNGYFAVIIAGYPEPILEMIDSAKANPGLARRFPKQNRLSFADYTAVELHNIFLEYIDSHELLLEEKLRDALPIFFSNLYQARDPSRFGNAGDIINLINEMNQYRVLREGLYGSKILLLSDVPHNLQHHLKEQATLDGMSAFDQLNVMVGLAPVKEQMHRLASRLRMDQLRNTGRRPDPGHYLFMGAAGTGKTTVARILGSILREQGLLSRGHVVEVGRDALVAGFQGQTALKTKEKLLEALDGILFIDEAYQLINGAQDNFGRESLETLIAFMENHRDRLSIVAAGYPEEMLGFIQSNSGLASRFKYTVNFPNYFATELMEILALLMGKDKLYFTPAAKVKVVSIFQSWESDPPPGFANARNVRNLLDKMLENQAMRLSKLHNPDSEALRRIELDDVPDLPFP